MCNFKDEDLWKVDAKFIRARRRGKERGKEREKAQH
jgi:hypothetical protein